MDRKRLEEISKYSFDCIDEECWLELLAMAKWAIEHGKPACEHYESAHYDGRGYSCASDDTATQALTAFPESGR